MEIKVHTSANVGLLYNLLLESFLYDIGSSGKEMTLKNLSKGFEYKKILRTKMGSERHVQVRLAELKENKKISFNVIENKGYTSVTYELFPSKKGTEIIYSESFIGNSRTNDLNQRIMMIPFSYFAKRKFKKKVRVMEKSIKDKT